MPMISDYVLDNGLSTLDLEANRLDIHVTGEPTTYAAAIGATSRGNKTGLDVGAPTARTPNGRRVTVTAFTDGMVTGDGLVGFWSIVDTVGTRLLATGPLTNPQQVTSNNPFSLPAFDFGIPAAV